VPHAPVLRVGFFVFSFQSFDGCRQDETTRGLRIVWHETGPAGPTAWHVRDDNLIGPEGQLCGVPFMAKEFGEWMSLRSALRKTSAR